LRNILRDKHGEPAGAFAIFAFTVVVVATLIGLGLALPIGMAIIHSTASSVTQSGFTATENTTMTAISTNTQTGMAIMANSPLLAAAGGIIGLLFIAFGFIMSGGRRGV
jgi:hypothetical protein